MQPKLHCLRWSRRHDLRSKSAGEHKTVLCCRPANTAPALRVDEFMSSADGNRCDGCLRECNRLARIGRLRL